MERLVQDCADLIKYEIEIQERLKLLNASIERYNDKYKEMLVLYGEIALRSPCYTKVDLATLPRRAGWGSA
jgi:hypothetical protein